MQADTFEELEAYLRSFTNFGGGPPFDTVGAMTLLLAIADNIESSAGPEEIEDFLEIPLTDRQRHVFGLLAK